MSEQEASAAGGWSETAEARAPDSADESWRDDASPASLETLRTNAQPGKPADLDSILDIPVTLSVEIGKSKPSIRDLLQLNQGSVVELDRV
ncbi:MAG: FliM/FliN family flagellar motor switch protein, partial [Gammaproteobacteria bacterium]